MNTHLLFVYGTLRSDSSVNRADLLGGNSVFIGRGFVQGRLYDLGWYPGLVLSDNPEEQVCGEIYRMTEPAVVLAGLDEYEGCSTRYPEPHEYRRKEISAKRQDGKSENVWAYIYNHPTADKKRITGGDYVEYIKESP
ncbi:gamma-glutamylcyclotransferase [Rhodohalobacter sp. SW132]|uniref:gamma-glutamylcyclotransferase family protein n=1 Tax=Rhodohalobacter sp. SW132 TaxID=2293433 RepID=UPI000E223752|nr:gamma-glutamylcyclotransferase family protein [Rhodohalobacter sp. SW132]REL24055.1 gamma-glutamylcyclotransferase [Rhodohalobacter sp. SW132]